MTKCVVIGAGQAGAALVAKLRGGGFDGQITLIGDEPVPPYQRPPLSKKYLLGEMALERLFLRPESYYAEAGIDLCTGTRVTGIDRAARTIATESGDFAYDHLVLATGSTPRHLPEAIGGNLQGVYPMRDLRDADRMAPEFRTGAHLLIIGGGYIGLEAAAVAAMKGLKVTLVEAAGRILQRVAARETSDYFRALHQKHGVRIIEGTGLKRLTGSPRITGAVLSDGTGLDIDFAITGIGILPETGLAEAAGLEIDNGIRVDAKGRTSDKAIWAVGDCASFPHQGQRLRLESVPNAIDMGECVAANIMGAAQDYLPRPWFWSDQYDVKLQIAGLNTGYTHVITRQEGEDTSFWYYKDNQLLAVDAMNAPRAYMVGKRLIEAGRSADPGLVADPGTALKSLL